MSAKAWSHQSISTVDFNSRTSTLLKTKKDGKMGVPGKMTRAYFKAESL